MKQRVDHDGGARSILAILTLLGRRNFNKKDISMNVEYQSM